MIQTRKQNGFTLIELLVVIAIIGLLSTLAVVSLSNARTKSRDAKRVADIGTIRTALELYYADNGTYPILTPAATLSATQIPVAYMSVVPTNPTPNGAAYTYLCAGAGTPAVCASYTLTFTLEGQSGSLAAGGHTATPTGIAPTP